MSLISTWATWLAENPDTQVLEAREKFAEMYWKETDEEEARGEEIVPFPVAADSSDAVDRGALLDAVRRVRLLAQEATPVRLTMSPSRRRR